MALNQEEINYEPLHHQHVALVDRAIYQSLQLRFNIPQLSIDSFYANFENKRQMYKQENHMGYEAFSNLRSIAIFKQKMQK